MSTSNGAPQRHRMKTTPITTLAEAREWLRVHVDLPAGAYCPTCQQIAKVYKRPINSGMAYALLLLWKAAGTDWVHKPTILKGVGAAARDEGQLRHWGLLEEEATRRADGGRAGWWRVTERGEQWILGRVTVPKYVFLFANKPLGYPPEQITVRQALGSKFNYDELMGATGRV